MMKQITKELEFHFNVDKYIGDSQNERDMAIYSEAIVLPNNVDYRNLLIQIKFGDSKNIPNKIKIYCFKPKTELEKSKLSKNKPCTFISFFKHNIQSVFQKQKSKQNFTKQVRVKKFSFLQNIKMICLVL